MREELPRENGWEWYEIVCGVSEGYGASGSRGECSSERVSSRGNRAYQVQHGGVPDTRVPENGTEIKTIEVP